MRGRVSISCWARGAGLYKQMTSASQVMVAKAWASFYGHASQTHWDIQGLQGQYCSFGCHLGNNERLWWGEVKTTGEWLFIEGYQSQMQTDAISLQKTEIDTEFTSSMGRVEKTMPYVGLPRQVWWPWFRNASRGAYLKKPRSHWQEPRSTSNWYPESPKNRFPLSFLLLCTLIPLCLS